MQRSIMAGTVLAAVIGVFCPNVRSSGAATAEEIYLVVRDTAIAKYSAADTKGPTDDKLLEAEKQTRASLERQMRAIVGDVAIKGLPSQGSLNLDTLFQGDAGFGMLDGIIYGTHTDKTRVIITTESMLQHWLKGHKDWWGKGSADIPQDMSDAVRVAAFYTQAVSTDAAVMKYAELPVRGPQGARFAFALLAARSQDRPPPAANEIFVAVAQGGRVFIADTTDFAPVGPIPTCDKIRRDFEKQAQDIYRHSALSHQQQSKQSEVLSEKSETEFLRCFDSQVVLQSKYNAAVRAAQALIDRLSLR